MLPEKEKGLRKKKKKTTLTTDFFSGTQNTEEQHHKISEIILILNLHFYIQLKYQSNIRAKKDTV